MDYSRIRRGMIFWKEGEPVETRDSQFSEKKYPWVVVSSDERNAKHHVSIVPIYRMSRPPKAATNYVGITFHNDPAYIMCDTIQTVQGSMLESSQYGGWMSEDVMDKVSDCIRKSLSVEYTAKDLMSTSAAEQLEVVIDQIVQKKLAEVQSSLPSAKLDDAAIKISEHLEDLFDVKAKEPSSEKKAPEPAEEARPDVSETFAERTIPTKPIKNKWTEDAIIEFLHKFDMSNKDQLEYLVKEYHFKNMATMLQTRRHLAKKLAEMSN